LLVALAGSGRRKTMSSGVRFLVTNFHIDMLKMLMIAPPKIHLFMTFFKFLITILLIKACFWGSRNFCNRWTLVTCRVDCNWTSEGLGLGLRDIKVNEICYHFKC
jgi:hypothetical protein